MPESSRHRLEATAELPQRARSLVARALDGFSSEDEREIAELLASELVTNALRHTDTDVIELEVSVDGRVRVGVTDVSPRLPERRPNRPEEPGGLGLVIVEELADRWGIDAVPGNGKRVWFELAAHAPGD